MSKINGLLLLDTVQINRNVSSDKLAATVAFDFLDVSIGVGGNGEISKNNKHIDTKTASISIPLSENEVETKVKAMIRGFIQIDPEVVSILVVIFGNQIKTFNYEDSSGIDKAIEESIYFTIPANNNCQLTFVLYMGRDSSAPNYVGGLLVLEALDLEISSI